MPSPCGRSRKPSTCSARTCSTAMSVKPSSEITCACTATCWGMPPKHTFPGCWRLTDCQLDRFADTAEHLHERIDRELGCFLVHHVGHPRARDHQNLGGL